jgi:hypothetical protein
MLQSILTHSAAAIVVYIMIQFVFLQFTHKQDGRSKLMKKGLEAYAVVLTIQPTGVYIDDLPQICMLLKVQPYTGRNFVAETKEVMSPLELSKLRAGSSLKVKYNPHNLKEVTVIK